MALRAVREDAYAAEVHAITSDLLRIIRAQDAELAALQQRITELEARNG